MKYTPLVKTVVPLEHHRLGEHTAILFGDAVPAGNIHYRYLLAVFDPGREPCLFVSSEVRLEERDVEGAPHHLGVFPGEGHEELDVSPRWAEREQFTRRALEIARQRLGLEE